MFEFVVFSLGASLVFYTLLGGADFGAGILELFLRHPASAQRKVISKAMGPVWEANHVWLILGVVILFMGFPGAYSQLSISFHLPLLFLLLGIVVRGCAFTFRYYDAFQDQSQKYYTLLFALSSVWSSFFIGVLAGGIFLSTKVSAGQGSTYREYFIDPWANRFCLSSGIFVCALHAFLASVYLIGETKDPELKRIFSGKAKVANIASVFAGGLVFLSGELSAAHLLQSFFERPLSLACMAFATLLLIPLWKSLESNQIVTSRVVAVSQVSFILLGWYAVQYPKIIGPLTFDGASAPSATLRALGYALIFGYLVVLPSFFYLLKVFKRTTL
ncbi:MAG: cytochrome d ubiquinol oxidase subunit II [Bdellovibrionota bacterium]